MTITFHPVAVVQKYQHASVS